MKRGVGILLLAAAVCLLAYAGMYHYRTQENPDEWLGRQLGLDGPELAAFTEAHNQYAGRCAEMCERIEKVNRELVHHVASSREMTPKIIAAIEKSESLRAECRQNMLRHFYQVAGMLSPDQAEEYLRLVLPLVTENERMEAAHHP